MDEVYELRTHEVEDDHWWYRGRRRVIEEALGDLDLAAGLEILDAGCGSGRNMVDLARFGRVTGLELADASVAKARSRGVGEVVQGTLDDAVPFAAASFDLAVSFDVIEHLDNDRGALRELRRVVRPGGLLMLTVPAYQWLWSEHDVVNHHRRRYTRRTLEAAAGDAGWHPVASTHFNGLLLPAAVAHRGLLRLRSRATDGTPAVSDLERTPLRLNRLLERPLELEARLIGSGRRIPCGLSLLGIFD